MLRRAPVLGLCLLALAGCGDDRLTGRGYVRIHTSDDARAAIELPNDVRLDGEIVPGRITGSCQVSRSVVGGRARYGVVVDLYTNADDALRSVTLIQRTEEGAQGTIEARFVSGTYRSTSTCDLDLSYVDDGGSAILDATGCALDAGDGRTGLTDVHLELHGCTVTAN